MPYSITMSFHEQILHAVVEGRNSKQNVDQYLNEIQRSAEEHQCTSILIEDGLNGPGLEPFDVFDVIRNHAKYAKQNHLRIAYVDLNKNHHRTTVAFGENLANILGVNVKVFSTVPKAKEWLTSVDED